MHTVFKSLLAGLLGTAVFGATAQDVNKTGHGFTPTKLRSEYLRMPAADLSPMLDWLESTESKAATTEHVSPLLIHAMLLHGQDAQALSRIQAARSASDKPLQRNMLFFIEGLLAQARIEGWNETRFAAAATQGIAALPWPAARSRLKELLPSLEITPFEQTLAMSAYADPAYRLAPLNSPALFAGNIVETRFSGEVLGPHAAMLRAAIQARLDRAAEPGYWEQRAYPEMPPQGQAVHAAVWEPDGVDIGLFRRPASACLTLGNGADCLVDPRIDGVDRAQAWAFVKGYQDSVSNNASPQARAWQDWQTGLAKEIGSIASNPERHEELIRLMQRMGEVTNEVVEAQARQHGTHVAGIVVQGNPFVELFVIRDSMGVAESGDAYRRIRDFLRTNEVRIVNMSWGFPAELNSRSDVAAFEKNMLDLFAQFPDTLFVAAAGNDDAALDKHRYLPGALSAPNLITIGAVDQDGQVTSFTNVGERVALYANGDMVRSMGPTGYPLDMSGTSMAAPQVCNVAARLLSQHPGLSVAELKRLLIDGADELTVADQRAAPIKVLNPAHSAALVGR